MQKLLKKTSYSLLFAFILLNAMAAFQAYNATHYYNINTPKKHINEMNFGEKLSAIFLGVKVPKAKVVDSLNFLHTDVTLITADGIHLAAWYGSSAAENKSAPAGTVIMFHGHGGSRSGVIKEAEAFHNFHYNVLMVDFRAHGQSEGNVCTIGYDEAKDVKAAYEYAVAKGEKNIILWGISLGASSIIKAVHDFSLQPSKIILEAPFGTLYKAVKGSMRNNHLPEEPASLLLTFWGGIEHGFWAFGMNPQEYAKSIHCPVLLQHGVNDIRVTENEVQTIFNSLPVKNKVLAEYTNCGHESMYKKDSIKWEKTVLQFLNSR